MVDRKQIESILSNLNSIESRNKNHGDYEVNGFRVPSVTEIITAMMYEPSLMSWANSLGFRRVSYHNYMKEAADKGTWSHLAIERYLKYKEVPGLANIQYPTMYSPVVHSTFNAFCSWWNKLKSEHEKVKVKFSEEKLVCPFFAGTCDCLLKVDDEFWLVDFKTSNHMSYNYPLQLSAYGYLLKKLKNIKVDRYVVLILNKENSTYREYILDLKNNEEHRKFESECLETFLLFASAYKMRVYTTDEYFRIFNIPKR